MLREEKNAQQRRNILKAALHVFARRGFDRAQTDQIAHRANIGKGTIYNHFHSKEGLFRALQEEILGQLFHSIVSQADDPELSPVKHVETVLARMYQFFRRDPDRYVLFASALSALPGGSGLKPAEVSIPRFEVLAPRIHEHISSGRIQLKQAEAESLALSFFGLAILFLHRWYCFPRTYDFESKIPFIAKIFVNGILTHEPKE